MKKVFCCIVALVLAVSMAVSVFAIDFGYGVMPYYEYFGNYNVDLYRINGTTVESTVFFEANSYTYRLVADCSLQKKGFLGIWSNVETWNVTVYSGSINDVRTFAVDESGTYRLKVELKAYYKLEKEEATFYSREV